MKFIRIAPEGKYLGQRLLIIVSVHTPLSGWNSVSKNGALFNVYIDTYTISWQFKVPFWAQTMINNWLFLAILLKHTDDDNKRQDHEK